jgi:hypothetical protein
MYHLSRNIMSRAILFMLLVFWCSSCFATASQNKGAIKIRASNTIKLYEVKKGDCVAIAAKIPVKSKLFSSLSYFVATSNSEQGAIDAVIACEHGYVCVFILDFCNE